MPIEVTSQSGRRSEIPRGRVDVTRPMWTVGLVVANLLVYVGMEIASVKGGGRLFHEFSAALLERFGAWYAGALATGEPERLLTAMFLHGGFFHLICNLVALVQAGSQAEELFGRRRFALLYVWSGGMGSLASVLGHGHADVPWTALPFSMQPHGVGASGAICGIFGGLFALEVRRRGLSSGLRRALVVFAAYAAVMALLMPRLDHFAHGGGFVAGSLLGSVLAERRSPGPLPAWAFALLEAGLIALLATAAVLQAVRG